MTKPARTTLLALIEAGQNAQRVLIRPLIERGLEPGDDAVLMLIGTKGASEAELEDGTGEPLDKLLPRLERLITREMIVRTAAGLALTERGARLCDRLEEIWAETELALNRRAQEEATERAREIADRLCRLSARPRGQRVTALPQSATTRADTGTIALAADYRANADARRRRSDRKRKRPRPLMRTLSLSLLYVLSMGMFVAAYGLLPLS